MVTTTKEKKGNGRSAGRPLLKDIASVAGVSKATASRALQGSGPVAAEVKERVRAVAERMGYRPNPFIDAFRQGFCKQIGLYSHVGLGGALTEFVPGLVEGLSSKGYRLVIVIDQAPIAGEEQAGAPQAIYERAVDGLVVFEHILPAALKEAKHHELPILHLMASDINVEGIGVVQVDFKQAVRKAISHLMDLGHRRIGGVFFGEGALNMPSCPNLWTQGFAQAIEGQSADSNLALVEDSYSWQSPEMWFERAIAMCPDMTAAVVQDIDSARSLMAYLEQRKIRVPEDFSVIATCQSGYGLHQPGTTVVERPDFDLGQTAGRAIVDYLEKGGDMGQWQQPDLLQPLDIIDFGTTGPVQL